MLATSGMDGRIIISDITKNMKEILYF